MDLAERLWQSLLTPLPQGGMAGPLAGYGNGGDTAWQRGVERATAPPFVPSPPDRSMADTLMAMGAAGNTIGRGAEQFAKHQADWFTTPGRLAAGVAPETPGRWSEEDEFRKRQLANAPYEWGPQTAFSEVFWPRAGGAGAVTSGAGSKIIQPENQGIRAYHGSPHDFERFDLSKIGTGEGAQSYGHGLYFAENPGTAEFYKKALAPKAADDIGQLAHQAMVHSDGNVEQAVAALRQRAATEAAEPFSGIPPQHMLDAAKMIERGETPKGRMYEVNINAKPEQFLDWDRPLAQQGQQVVGAIDKVSPGILNAEEMKMRTALSYLQQRYPTSDPMGQQAAITRALERFKNNAGFTGQDVHKRLIMNAPNRGGEEYVSSALREAGIPGIRYLDQGSRLKQRDFFEHPVKSIEEGQALVEKLRPTSDLVKIAGEPGAWRVEGYKPAQGTSNYVVFDDKIIDILRKYGMAGLSMLPPAVAMQAYSRLAPADSSSAAQ